MMNYIKSECYRVVHTKTFYIVMAVLSGLVLLMNIVNSISGHLIPDFRYDTFRFSLNSFTSFIMLMLAMGAVVSSLLLLMTGKTAHWSRRFPTVFPEKKYLSGNVSQPLVFSGDFSGSIDCLCGQRFHFAQKSGMAAFERNASRHSSGPAVSRRVSHIYTDTWQSL